MGKLKNNESGFSAVEVILVLVIVVLLGVVGWFVYKNQKTTPSGTTTTTTTTKPTSTTTTKPVDPYTGWKTFSTSALSATFKYPADWSESDSPTNGVFLISPDFHAAQGVKNISAGSHLAVNQNTSVAGVTLDQLASSSNDTIVNKQDITVDGVKAIRYTKTTTGENQDSSTNVIIIKDNATYYITQLYKLNADNPYPKLIDGVLATFKFK